MERVNAILENDLFKRHLNQNMEAEKDRQFCCHNMVHFLDVARIAALLNQEEAQGLDKEWIYAAALLHDLGRHIQYENNTPHEVAGAQIAPDILYDCGFDNREIKIITEAIAAHRNQDSKLQPELTGLLYRADKLSRACFACKAEADCVWTNNKKNLKLSY